MRVCTSIEARDLDRQAQDEFGISSEVLMENAGRRSASILLREYPSAGIETEILVLAGRGNNAGDAFVVARHLLCEGRRVRVFHLSEIYQGACLKNFEILKKFKTKLTHVDNIAELDAFLTSTTGPLTIVDGILGTGLRGDLDGLYFDVVESINRLNCAQVISLDIPTGVSGTTGSIHGTSIQATLTISFGFPKMGHFLAPGAVRRGKLVNAGISLPPSFAKGGNKFLLTMGPVAASLQERDRYGHKNSFGHTLFVGGSRGRLGAISLAARACQKMGTGLVTVATWEDCLDLLMMRIPDETMALPIRLDAPELNQVLKQFSSIVIGPGLGLRPEGKEILELVLAQYQNPIVIDADALNLIAEHKLMPLLLRRKAPTVLTPHPGEMARLLERSKEDILKDPIGATEEAVARSHSIVILKGAATVVSNPEGGFYLNHYPNDGMATAGSGDVLAGMIGGLLGQKMEPFLGTKLGVYVHTLSGGIAAEKLGHRSMTAHDIIDNIGSAFRKLREFRDRPYDPKHDVHLL